MEDRSCPLLSPQQLVASESHSTTKISHMKFPLRKLNTSITGTIQCWTAPYSKPFAYKTKAYEFEKEVRVLIDRFHGEFDNPFMDNGMALKVDPKKLLCAIVIAPEAPLSFETTVRAESERYGIIAPIHRSSLANEPV